MTTPAVVMAVMHDGFYGCGTGAGRSNRAFLLALTELLAPAVRLVVLPVRLVPGSSEYDPAWHQQAIAILAGTAGDVVPVDNGTAGLTRFGGLDRFRTASASAAASISLLLPSSSRVLIVAFDVPFFGLAPLLPPQARAGLVNVARATAALQAPGDSERIAWERAGLLATAAAGGHIAATSRHIRDHLATAYRIPQPAITDLINGLTRAEQAPGPDPGNRLVPAAAEHGFLLSFGRAEPYKGFDDLLDALRLLSASGLRVPHTILAAVTDGPPLTAYQRHLACRINAGHLDVTLRTTFSPGIRALLAHPALAAVIVPSRAEPFGRIPLEAWAAGASPVIATTAGGLAETVTEPLTGYTASPADPPSLAAAIGRALTASPATHACSPKAAA
ncbi:MAG: glycosyltransferase [Streptosporangiaceae bacterium]|jgi:glycosyltransferase involved in cell wall biosynthesis